MMLRESHGADIAIVVYASDVGDDPDMLLVEIVNIQANSIGVTIGDDDLISLLDMAMDLAKDGTARVFKHEPVIDNPI